MPVYTPTTGTAARFATSTARSSSLVIGPGRVGWWTWSTSPNAIPLHARNDQLGRGD